MRKSDEVINGNTVGLLERLLERLTAENRELKAEVALDNQIIASLEAVVEAIPACDEHGDHCIPNALAWVEQQKKGESAAVAVLKHDLSNEKCASRLLSEAYDRMVLKYESRIAELEKGVNNAGHKEETAIG